MYNINLKTIDQDKKAKLITALIDERDRFKAKGHSVEHMEHDKAIYMLNTGTIPQSFEEMGLVESILIDFEDVYNIYCEEEK